MLKSYYSLHFNGATNPQTFFYIYNIISLKLRNHIILKASLVLLYYVEHKFFSKINVTQN